MKPAVLEALRTAYRAIPMKVQIFGALRRVWLPSERVFRHLHFEGPFDTAFHGRSFKLFHSGTWIENTLFWQGIGVNWERVSLQVWARLAERAAIVLDIGANTGVYATLASAMNPRARVLAFEPNPNFSRAIVKCNELNGFDIRIHELALSDVSGTIEFSGYQVGSPVSSRPLPKGWVRVPVTTLTAIIESEKLAGVDLVKCDVERHEPQVFSGMGRYLAEFRPDILIEVLDDECAEKLDRLFWPLDYRYYTIDDPKGTIGPIPSIRKSAHWNVLVCKPETGAFLEADRTLPWA